MSLVTIKYSYMVLLRNVSTNFQTNRSGGLCVCTILIGALGLQYTSFSPFLSASHYTHLHPTPTTTFHHVMRSHNNFLIIPTLISLMSHILLHRLQIIPNHTLCSMNTCGKCIPQHFTIACHYLIT